MNELVQRLSNGEHPVVASRVHDSVNELKNSIDRGLVHIKFTDTQGGTELGVRLNMAETSLDKADFSQAAGHVRLVGNLSLNYVNVTCQANIDLATLKGIGSLDISEL